jgi:oxygen-dependent protoporphyrinogen oxidase
MTIQDPRPDAAPRVAVLGGGMSGLSAAFHLSERMPQARICVFEDRPAPGGLVSSSREGDCVIESGPLAFPYGNSATGELLDRAGLADRLIPSGTGRGLGLWDGKRLFPFPRTAFAVLANRVLSPLGLLRLLAEPFIPVTKGDGDESVRDFFGRRTGLEFLDRLIEPFIACILAGDSRALSLGSNLPAFRALERGHGSLALGYLGKARRPRRKADGAGGSAGPSGNRVTFVRPAQVTTREGCSAIVRGLEDHLRGRGVEFRFSHRVTSLRLEKPFRLGWIAADGANGHGVFDAVVSCLPAPVLADLAGDLPGAVRDILRGIPFSPISLAHLAIPMRPSDREGARFRGDGFLSQSRAGEPFLSCFFPSRLAPGRCPPGHELLRVLSGGARPVRSAGQGGIGKPGESDALHAAAEMAGRILGFKETPVFQKQQRHFPGLPQLVVGHGAGAMRMAAWLERHAPGLVVAGTSIQGSGVENAVVSGKRAAEKIAKALAG